VTTSRRPTVKLNIRTSTQGSMAGYIQAPKSSVIYYNIPGVEDVFLYTEGGLHPIQIGDSFQDGRFRILNKLGFGGYSTVWLATDNSRNRLIVLKVLRSDISLRVWRQGL
jgi:hypothetical protein